MTITIKLTKNQTAQVDDIDADLGNLKWTGCFLPSYGQGGDFVATRNERADGKRRTIYMHRVIMSRILGRPLLRSEKVDHIDFNPLNNRRENLRLANNSQNNQYRRKQSNNTSGYKGAIWHKASEAWVATIWKDGRPIVLGYYNTPLDAGIAYNHGAKQHYGEFAYFNPIPGWENIIPEEKRGRHWKNKQRRHQQTALADQATNARHRAPLDTRIIDQHIIYRLRRTNDHDPQHTTQTDRFPQHQRHQRGAAYPATCALCR